MNKKTKDFLIKAFLLFIVGVFSLFEISNFLLGVGRNTIIKVGKRNISITHFMKSLNQNRMALYKNNPKEDTIIYLNSPEFKYDILDRVLKEELLNNEIYNLKINLTKKNIAKIISQNQNFLDEKGKFDDVSFQTFLKSIDLSEKEYLEYFAEYYSRALLISLIYETPLLINDIISKVATYKNQIRQADIFTINLKTLPIQVKNPSLEEQKKYYDEFQEIFKMPEQRKLSYIELDINNYTKNISISEKQIKAEYNRNQDAYKIAESRDIYYLASTNKNVMKLIKKELDNGGDVLQLAKQYLNRDKKYIHITDVKKGMLESDLEKQIEALRDKEYSDIIKNNNFYAIFYIEKFYPETKLSFDNVKASIRKDLFKNQKEEIVLNLIVKLEDKLLTADNLKELADEFKLKIKNLGYLSKDKLLSMNLCKNKEVEELFKYQIGDLSDLIETNENKYKVFFVEDIKLARYRTFEEVKNEITKQMVNKKKIELAEIKINEIVKELKTSQNLALIAQKYNLQIKNNITVKNTNKEYSQNFIDNLYNLKKIGDISEPSKENETVYKISILRSIKNLTNKDKEFVSLNEITEKFTISLQNSALTNYLDNYLQHKYDIKVNDRLLREVE
jgi:peptidyl-prolyl cis-trans isomerase D